MSRFNHANFFRRWTVAVPTTGALGASLLAALAGCSSGPGRVTQANISASGAASAAMTEYDKDGDGFIAGAELDAAASLKAAMATLDLDKDGKVSADEIQKRIEAWQATGVGVTQVSVRVTMDGKPLPGATVTLEPEAFLGDGVKTATGVTNAFGVTEPSIAKADRPNPDWPPGLQYGFFKIRVTNPAGGAALPSKYNTDTTLGHQIARDDPQVMSQMVKVELTGK